MNELNKKGGYIVDKLVFLNPDSIEEEPFTTSEVVAEHGKVRHDTVQRLIRNYDNDLKEFGKLGFEIRPLPSGQSEKVYHLNEQQATLLITFMKNTVPVVKFKKALVKQFYIMQKELTSRRITRQIGKEAREALTNAIQELPESPHKGMKYKHYTDLVYKTLFSKNAKQLKESYGIGKHDDLRSMFTAEELDKILKLERQISVLIELGYEYSEIKEVINRSLIEKGA